MASQSYVTLEAPIVFADSAQTPNVLLTLSALASNAGRLSAQLDRGAGAHAGWYTWRFTCRLTGTNVLLATVELYLATSDGVNGDGQLGTADAALASDKRSNLRPLGALVVDQTTSNTAMTASGEVFLPHRYLSAAVWNATSLPFQTDTSAHRLVLTPFADEAQ